jgi:hypothetical protein
MSGLLKRFSELFSNSNPRKLLLWAIGEVFIVIIGILLALQIDNYVQYHKDRNTERSYIEGLLTDISNDSIGFADSRLVVENSLEMAISAYSLIESKIPVKDTLAFINDFKRSYSFAPGLFTAVTWNELNSTGNVRLISNRALYRKLAVYYDHRHTFDDSILPEFTDEINEAHSFDKDVFHPADQIDYFNDFKQDTLKHPEVMHNLLHDARAASVLKRTIVAHRVYLLNQILVSTEANLVKKLLNRELESF